MLEKIPSESIMTDLLGKQLYDVWLSLSAAIDERYDMERSWNNGGKKWIYEYKYRKGGKNSVFFIRKGKLLRLHDHLRKG